jgi:RND family efflux transporter MFP subunit
LGNLFKQEALSMKKTNLIILFLIITVIVLINIILLKGPDKNTASADTPAIAALTVTETIVSEKEWPETIKASGAVFAWQEAIIGTEISGQRLIKVIADVGDIVKKGDLLAQFNIEILDAEFEELKANWVTAEENRKRAVSLKGSGAISDQAIEDYINKAKVSKAQMDAKALQLKYADIVSPDDGIISARNATLGAVGGVGDELFRLIRQNRLEWRGELTPEQSARVVQGQQVFLYLPNDKKTEGKIRQISPSFNPETRMTTIFVDIIKGSSARAGMYIEGEIILGKQTSLSIPVKSIVIRDGHNYIFSLENHMSGKIVRQHEVRVGQIRGDEAQILSGIIRGDHIVESGAGFLNDGDIVRVSPEKGGAL